MELKNHRKMNDEKLEQAVSLIVEYVRIAYEYSELKRNSGIGWKSEYAELEKKLCMRLNTLRKRMGMEPVN